MKKRIERIPVTEGIDQITLKGYIKKTVIEELVNIDPITFKTYKEMTDYIEGLNERF